MLFKETFSNNWRRPNRQNVSTIRKISYESSVVLKQYYEIKYKVKQRYFQRKYVDVKQIFEWRWSYGDQQLD